METNDTKKRECISCGSSEVDFYEFRGLNEMLVCRECGLIFADTDKNIEEAMEEWRNEKVQ